MKKCILFLLLASSLSAQKRYLVSPNDEVIPLRRGESPSSIIARRSGRSTASTATLCGSRFILGYPEDIYPANSNFGAFHKDVIGEWFVAKAAGTIDTIYWEALGSVGAKDSMIFVRIHNSRIGPDYGPGVRIPPHNTWNPPCQNWGYFINTNDSDGGIAAFPDEATPPGTSTWTSTIQSGEPTEPPMLEPLWGLGGFGVLDHAGRINSLALMDAGSNVDVSVGQKFFISQELKGPAGPTDEARTEWAASGFRVDNKDESYPSRDWKFYERDSSASNCAGVPVNQVKKGWVARGGFGNDTLDVAVFNIWYSMVVTTNVPPHVPQTSILHNTFSTDPRTVDAEVLDCDPERPSRAGVKIALLKWQVNGVPQTDLPMANVGSLTRQVDIPGENVGSTVEYKVYAEDSTGLFSYGPPITYKVVQASNGYARIDTSGPCAPRSIASNPANVIPPSAFFLPPGSPLGVPLDNGTAGPFDMGSNMPLFGDVGHYMWIGVNGGLAISKSATEIVDVNANGRYAPWGFPYTSSLRRGGRSDSAGVSRMPGNFFAPLWADLWAGDSVGGLECSHIRFQRGFGGDTCLVIAEWDSIGAFSLAGGATCDELTFRAIFNKCDGTIEYQYDNVGTLGEDSSAIIGFEADSTSLTVPDPALNRQPPYIMINEYGYPSETRPRSGWCLKIYQGTISTALAGWNLLSVLTSGPVTTLFPNAKSPAWTYKGHYIRRDTLSPGEGYFIKFFAGQNVGAVGKLLHDMVDTLGNGWNLIGTIGFPVSTGSLVFGGGAAQISQFYTYNGAYNTTTVLSPGRGFWLKTSGAGTLAIHGGVPTPEPKNVPTMNSASLNSITITDDAGRHQQLYFGEESTVKEPLSFYDLPPAAPDFDTRFASGRMVETYPTHLSASVAYEYPIHIQTDAYPLTITWNIVTPNGRKIVLTTTEGKFGSTVLEDSGKLKIADANVKNIVISLSGKSIPKEFALLQNYPNPFNPTTNLSFVISHSSLVSLKIFDILGREVATLVNEEREPGAYSVAWDAGHLASGMYFYELKAGAFRDVKKLVLVR